MLCASNLASASILLMNTIQTAALVRGVGKLPFRCFFFLLIFVEECALAVVLSSQLLRSLRSLRKPSGVRIWSEPMMTSQFLASLVTS